MAIPREDVAAVRAATDLVALVGDHVALKRQGRRWVGLCPFHQEKTPSFSVNAEEGLYYCFGCQAAGDAIGFVRAVDGLDFVEAVERLAEGAGITLHTDEPGAARVRDTRRLLTDALETAVAWYHQRLLSHRDAAGAREYLRSRGYDGDTVRTFRLGWAPEGWDELARALRVPDSVFRGSGLGFVNRTGRQQDGFRGRVVFPIFDVSGRAVALGGRELPGRGEGPKYRNSPETAVYSKRRVLYGLNWAKSAIVESGEAVVCEGYTDVIAMWRSGVTRAVATCGTALGEDHFRLLHSFARRVVLAYDADAAGRAAAERFYEWESRHELDIAVAALAPGSDPDDVGRDDPGALAQAVAGARPFLEFRLERVMEGSDLRAPEGRARAAEEAVGVVSEHPNALVRDQYLMAIADRCRVEPARLRSLARARAGERAPAGRAPTAPDPVGEGRARPAAAVPVGKPAGTPDRVELAALGLLAQRRDEVAGLMDAALFGDPLNRSAYSALAASAGVREAIDASPPEVASLLGRAAVEEVDAAGPEVVSQLVDRQARKALADLGAEARRSPGRETELMERTTWLRLCVESVRQDRTDMETLRRLVAWLSERAKEDA